MRASRRDPGPNQMVMWTRYALTEDRRTYQEPKRPEEPKRAKAPKKAARKARPKPAPKPYRDTELGRRAARRAKGARRAVQDQAVARPRDGESRR